MRIEILGFKQDSIIENGLSFDEILILKNIEDFINSGKTRNFYDENEGCVYHWISYQKILEDLPILNISKDRLSRILLRNLTERPSDFYEKLENYSPRMKKEAMTWKYAGMLKVKTIKNQAEGTRTYFSLTDKFYNLKSLNFDSIPYGENTEGHGENTVSDTVETPIGGTVKTPSPDTVETPSLTRRKHRTKDNIYIYKYIVEYLNKKAFKCYKDNSAKTQKLITARFNEGFDLEDFKKVIDIKVEAWLGTDMEKYLRPETLFGTKFEAYLNEAPMRKKVEQEVTKTGINRFKEL